jgi:hypothetical protein
MNLTNHGQNYISALKKKYEFLMEEAKANLILYLSNSNLAAIGEHSDLLTEQDKWISQYTDAKDKLESLVLLFESQPTKING